MSASLQLFPRRDEPRRGWLLPVAIVLSLLLHVIVGGVWELFGHRIAAVVARALPRPTPTPEIVALSDAITIEKRTVPREAHRSRAVRPQRRAMPRPRAVAELPQLRQIPLPTLPPIATPRPTIEPSVVPTARAVNANIHRPLAEPTPPPLRRVRVPETKPAPKTPFSLQQMAALDQQFRRTIAAADRSLTDVPRQRRPPAISPNAQRYAAIMAGTPQQFLTAQGDCVSLQDRAVGVSVARVLRCLIRYSDGYYEEVTFPWEYRFLRRTDPFGYADGMQHPFPMQAPPPGFALPQPFALSRAVCSFYHAQCQGLIDREAAAGNQPVPPSP